MRWASVRATGKQKVVLQGKDGDKERELAPALIFQAKMLMQSAETIAYGPKCKVSQSTAAESAKNPQYTEESE